MYVKHRNKFQSDMPSHIREMAKESYLNIFGKRRLGAVCVCVCVCIYISAKPF